MNVVYSCGSLLRGRQLIIRYTMSDDTTTFATLSLEAVLAAMEQSDVNTSVIAPGRVWNHCCG